MDLSTSVTQTEEVKGFLGSRICQAESKYPCERSLSGCLLIGARTTVVGEPLAKENHLEGLLQS